MKKSEGSAFVVSFGLGSNFGDREASLRFGIGMLAANLKHVRVSSPYSTQPLERSDQPPYLNAALVASSELRPQDLLGLAKAIERAAGRRRAARFAARPLDIDLLTYGNACLEQPELTLPHPRLREREFVLAPLAEIAPNLAVPPDGSRVADLLATRAGQQGVARQSWSLRFRELIP